MEGTKREYNIIAPNYILIERIEEGEYGEVKVNDHFLVGKVVSVGSNTNPSLSCLNDSQKVDVGDIVVYDTLVRGLQFRVTKEEGTVVTIDAVPNACSSIKSIIAKREDKKSGWSEDGNGNENEIPIRKVSPGFLLVKVIGRRYGGLDVLTKELGLVVSYGGPYPGAEGKVVEIEPGDIVVYERFGHADSESEGKIIIGGETYRIVPDGAVLLKIKE